MPDHGTRRTRYSLRRIALIALALVAAGLLLPRAFTEASGFATVVASATDQDGLPVRGNCFLLSGPGLSVTRCDSADGTVDGAATFVNIPEGSYAVRQSYTPIGFAPPFGRFPSVSAVAGETATISFTSPRTDLQVTLVDGSGNLVPGACFNVSQGNYSRTVCDGRGAAADGVTLIDYVPAGLVTLTQPSGPATHSLATPRQVTVTAGTFAALQITVDELAKVDVPVSSADQYGEPTRGNCFRLSRGSFNQLLCDAWDGVVDGAVTFTGVPAAAGYTVRQVYTPIGSAEPAVPSQTINVSASGPNGATFVSPRTDLRVTVRDQAGHALLGACIRVTFANYQRTLCDGLGNSGGLNGETLVTFVPAPGTTVSMATTPVGYVTMAPQSLTITPGVENTLDVTLARDVPVLALANAAVLQGGTETAATTARFGDTLTFRVDVRNGGTRPATGLLLSDDRGTIFTCPPAALPLAPDATVTCAGDSIVTAADVQRGWLANVLTASANDAVSVTAGPLYVVVEQASATVTTAVTDGDGNPVEPSADPIREGQALRFTFTVTNTGAAPIAGIAVDNDILPDPVCAGGGLSDGTLDPAEIGTCSLDYTFGLLDRLNGGLVNTATLTAPILHAPLPASPVSLTATPNGFDIAGAGFRDAALTDAITGDLVSEGDSVWVRATVTNTNLVELTNVELVVDPSGVAERCSAASVAPGSTFDCVAQVTIPAVGSLNERLGLRASVGADQLDGVASAVVFDPRVNRAPRALANPVSVAVATGSGTLPDSVVTLAGITDPDGEGFAVVPAPADWTKPNGNAIALDTDGTGTYTLAENADTTFDVRVRDARGGVLVLRVTIDADTQPPTVSIPGDTTLEAEGPWGAVLATTASATDDRDPDPLVSCTDANGLFVEAGDSLPIGSTTLTCEAEDSAGNVSASQSFTVEVVDTTAPAFDSPGAVLASGEAADPAGTPVDFLPPTATDLVDDAVDVTCSPASGSAFAIGTSWVSCTATDDAGNSATESFSVEVIDSAAPSVVLAPDDQQIALDPGASTATVSFAVTVTDAGDAHPAVTCDTTGGAHVDPAGTELPAGSYAITCTATDASGNTGTSNTITVRVSES